MQVTATNQKLTREEFSHFCNFLRTVYPDIIQIDKTVYLPEIEDDDSEVKMRRDIGIECSECVYQQVQVLKLANRLLSFRYQSRKRTNSLKISFVTTRRDTAHCYAGMIQEQYQGINVLDVLASGDNTPLDCSYRVQGVYDPRRRLMWFEAAGDSEDAKAWCVRQGVTYCASLEDANNRIYRLCRPRYHRD